MSENGDGAEFLVGGSEDEYRPDVQDLDFEPSLIFKRYIFFYAFYKCFILNYVQTGRHLNSEI